MDTTEQNTGQSAHLPLESVPYSTITLVLGILSIIGCCIYGVTGLVLGIIALILASKGSKAYYNNPEKYNPGTWNNIKAGRVCAIIGIIFSILVIILLVTIISIVGWDAISDPDLMQKRIDELMEQYNP